MGIVNDIEPRTRTCQRTGCTARANTLVTEVTESSFTRDRFEIFEVCYIHGLETETPYPEDENG